MRSILVKNWRAGFAGHLPESRNDAPGNRPGFSISYRPPIHFDNRNDLRSCTREETLIRSENVVPRDIRL